MEIAHLPAKPGVYLLKNKQGQIIYIGKSIDIRSRIKAHLQDNRLRNEAVKIDYLLAANEPEALIKESELIKKYQPKYNIMLRDDKQYFYVGFSHDKLPILSITHQPWRGLKVAGPFTDGKSLKTVVRYLRKAFPYYTQPHRKLPCSYCHIGLCPGPNPSPSEYKKNITKITAILNNKKPRVLTALKKEMAQYAKNLEFEKAAKARNQMRALENVFSHKSYMSYETYMTYETLEAYDISNIQGKEPVASMVRFDNGKPNKSMYRRFKIRLQEKPDDYAMMREVIRRRLAHPEWPYPDIFLVDGGRGQLNAVLKELNECARAPLSFRRRGVRGEVVALAKRFNELYIPGEKNPIRLDSLPQETKHLFMHARDEAHRFAITYHRRLHRKKSVL